MHKQTANPFTYGNPIRDPRRFFGRHREIEQVFSRLLNPEAESSSIVGSRRIGKTSLLMYLANPDVYHQHGLDPDFYNFIYIDLQVVDKETTPSQLWSFLLEQLVDQCRESEVNDMINELRDSSEINDRAIVDAFKAFDERDQHIVLLLDEFDRVIDNANFDSDFFDNLRSLAVDQNLSLITSSHHDLIDLTHSEAIRTSPFFNISANFNLSLFQEEEARQLINSSLIGTDVSFSKPETDAVIDISGLYPFFLQMACRIMFNAYREQIPPVERLEHLETMFSREAAPHFEYYWLESNNHEQIVLMALAMIENQNTSGGTSNDLLELETLYSHSDQALTSLTKQALVTGDTFGYSLFSKLFGSWIIELFTGSLGDALSYENLLNGNRHILNRLRIRSKKNHLRILSLVDERYRNLIVNWIKDTGNPDKVIALLKNSFY